jgi:hypothetical protein
MMTSVRISLSGTQGARSRESPHDGAPRSDIKEAHLE